MRFAIRVLWRSPSFSGIALLALVLGIGANTAIFSVVNAVLLRPMPFRDPSRLVLVWEASPRTSKKNVANPQNLADWQKRNRSFEKMAAYVPFQQTMSLTGDGTPDEVPGNYATRDFFSILGVQPILGRDFLPEEDVSGDKNNVALISEGLWRRRYGADPGILGKKLILRGTPTTVVGVLPASFRFPDVKADIWELIHLDPQAKRGGRFLAPIARLKAGVSIEQAQAEMNIITAELARENPAFDTKWGASVIPLRENFTGELRTPLLVLLGAVGLVLLIACANVANLMLMRSSARQREMAIRTSLGAGRARIIRQLLVESTILGSMGGLLGLLFAVWAKDGLLAMLPDDMSVAKVNSVTIDHNVLAFTAIASLGTGLLFGLLPALRASRPDLSDTLKEGGRAVSASLSRNRMRAALVAGEMALALMLLIGAGLLIKSFVRLENVAPGFQPDRILSLRIGLTSARYGNLQKTSDGLRDILHRIEQVPGVSSVGSIQWPPLSGLGSATGFSVAGRPTPKPGDEPVTGVSIVTPGYFATMSIPLIKGRLFSDRDRAGAPQVTIVSQSLARQQLPGVDPIGQRLFVQWGRQTPYEIVGVVGDIKHDGLDKESAPNVYFPDAQEPNGGGTLVIRTGADPMKLAPVIEQVIHGYDKDQAIADIQPLDVFLSKSVARPRFQSVLLASFAALALLLAAIGTFGVMSYSVAQRAHEIGIRVALGAQRDQVLRLVVGQGLVLALIGTAAGMAGAFVLTRYLRALLFNVSPTDASIFIAVPVVLCAVALGASYFPARKAAGVDPIAALRYE
ncbi:MAG TPA: ABC transporter permease [Bryobacteraceae bacterium]|nr:ABC transporter permease [Bryobacteraceae bacterium]